MWSVDNIEGLCFKLDRTCFSANQPLHLKCNQNNIARWFKTIYVNGYVQLSIVIFLKCAGNRICVSAICNGGFGAHHPMSLCTLVTPSRLTICSSIPFVLCVVFLTLIIINVQFKIKHSNFSPSFSSPPPPPLEKHITGTHRIGCPMFNCLASRNIRSMR